MKRFIILALALVALAAVPAALADDGGTTTTTTTTTATTTTPAPARHKAPKARTELVRLQLQLGRLRYRLHCRGGRNASTCTQFAQKAVDRLTTLDGNVQQRIAAIQQACPAGSTDARCKNADKKVAVLQKLDARLKDLIQRIQSGAASAADSDSSNG